MTSYDVFAPFYDEVMGDRGREGEFVHALIRKHCPEAITVLELACGTGSILERLQGHFALTGLDISTEMLDIAGEKVPQARLFRHDMTRFELGESFDVVLCVFDSINHLVTFGEWELVFDRAREHLSEGGIFVFDVNTQKKLAAFSESPSWTQWFGDDSLLLIDVKDSGRGIYEWKIRVFEHREGDTYRLHSADIRETAFPVERIRVALAERFARVRVYDPERSRPTGASLRLYFVCEPNG